MEPARLRLRLICDESRRALLSELLASRDLGPDEGGTLALVERGMENEEPTLLVFDPERLESLPAALDALAPRQPQSPPMVAVKKEGGIELVPQRSVLYFEAEEAAVRCFTASSSGEMRERLYELEARLPPSRFARVSKSAIVNLGAVREVHPWFGRGLLLRFGCEERQVEVSRLYVKALKDRLGL